MNILIVGDDGHKSIGMKMLREAAVAKWPRSKVISLGLQHPCPGQSASITVGPLAKFPHLEIEKGDSDTEFFLKGRPMDCVYHGILSQETFLGAGKFDLVLSGINVGANVGVDVFHSGTVMPVLLASSVFGLPTIAFSQHIPRVQELEGSKSLYLERSHFQVAEKFCKHVLMTWELVPGVCLNVNFPFSGTKGYKRTSVAPYSRWMATGVNAGRSGEDIFSLEEGYISISELELSLNSTWR